MKRWLIHSMICAGVLGACGLRTEAATEYPGPLPGEANASVQDNEIVLSNDAITCKWSIQGGHLRPVSITNKHAGITLALQDSECFQLLLAGGQTLSASDLQIGQATVGRSDVGHKAARFDTHWAAKEVYVVLWSPATRLLVHWRVVLRDGSNYVRQFVSFLPAVHDVDVREIRLLQLPAAQAKPAGTVDGSPVATGDMFFAVEHPLAKVHPVDANNRWLQYSLTVLPPETYAEEQMYGAVIGVAPQGQLRRAFLYYVERERAHPYRPFLHYNSWYDIGYGDAKILEGDALKVIDLFGKELIDGRKVALDSFVLDDGWDDPATLWQFHGGLPNGFTPLQRMAGRYRSTLGVWLSPWGGYGKPKEQRMEYGRKEGFETNKRGFSMAGAKYYGRFRDACMKMLQDYGVNYFKFDGISSGGTPTGADPEYVSDIEALLRLITELRGAKKAGSGLFINVTTGTWSSPYWLWYADSTWRSGSDWSTCGWGSKRQQQITYRDNETYHNVVQRAPLYPINSLMTQGVMFANHGLPDQAEGFTEDVHAFFASGTNCQELYLTPSLLNAQAWDTLAEAARWSRENAATLVDTHWIGGDPIKGDVYGWASWSQHKGILALRNPSDKPGQIAIDIGKAFELPQGAAQTYELKSPWKSDTAAKSVSLSAGQPHAFDLKPFEVLVFDATPR